MNASQHKRFLVIDDDEAFCQPSRSLQRKGYLVEVAQDLDSARQVCQQFSPHYAVVDLKIDQESGLEHYSLPPERFPDIRLPMLTGYSSIATAVDAIKLGADNYLQKPAGTTAILNALNEERRSPAVESIDPIKAPSLERMTWSIFSRR